MQDHGVRISGDSTPNPSDRAHWIEEETRIQAERHALARELHDTVVQPLTSLVTSFTCLEHLPQGIGQMDVNVGLWKELAQEALDSLRRTLAGLHTHPHAELDLPETLERFLAPQLCSRGMRLAVEPHNWPADLPVEWTANLFLVVREALTNAEKHARASMVIVVLRANTEELSISVTDNGIGFSADDLVSASSQDRLGSGLGISSMQDRVRMLGGELDLITARGCGVRLDLRVPNPNNARVELLSPAEAGGSLNAAMHDDPDTYLY